MTEFEKNVFKKITLERNYINTNKAIEILTKQKYFGKIEYYKHQIKQITKLIPCVLKALRNTFIFMVQFCNDLRKKDER